MLDAGRRRDAVIDYSAGVSPGAVVPLDKLKALAREPTGGGSPGAAGGESGDHSRRIAALEAAAKDTEQRAEAAAVTAGEVLTRIANAKAAVEAYRDQLRAAMHARRRAAATKPAAAKASTAATAAQRLGHPVGEVPPCQAPPSCRCSTQGCAERPSSTSRRVALLK